MKKEYKLFNQLAELGEKKVGTIANRDATELIFSKFKSFEGTKIIRESFNVRTVKNSKALISFNNQNENVHLYDQTGLKNNAVEASYLFVGNVLSTSNKDEAKGKILVFKYGVIAHRVMQIKSALKYGAVGVAIISKFNEKVQVGVGVDSRDEMCSIPAIGITIDQWNQIKSNNNKKLKIEYKTEVNNAVAENIICDLEGTDSASVKKILVGAHFDSWFKGCQDNCIAIELLFSILSELQKRKFKNTLRFCCWNAEELGLQGSGFHINNSDLTSYKAYINLEMPVPTKSSYFNTIIYSSHKIIKKSLNKLSILKIGYIPLPIKIYYFFGKTFPSDIDHFFKKDIPCLTTFCNNKFYHTHDDLPENIEWHYFESIKNYFVDLIMRIDENI